MGITTARVLTGPTTRCSMSRGHEGRLTGARIRSPLRVDVDWLAHGSVLSATTGRASTPGPNRRSRRAAMCGSRALGGVVNGYDEVNEKRFLPVVMPLAQIEGKAQTQISSSGRVSSLCRSRCHFNEQEACQRKCRGYRQEFDGGPLRDLTLALCRFYRIVFLSAQPQARRNRNWRKKYTMIATTEYAVQVQ